MGFNAVYVPSDERLYLPIFSTPSCRVIPPYGEFYTVTFTGAQGPTGSFPSCFIPPGETAPASQPCYSPARRIALDLSGHMDAPQNFDGGRYELGSFDQNGVATGMMDTKEGLVPLSVKACP